ncbi:uncharacterized protein F5147DRAFT_117811 [Suillus discolor]|uniref:Uncharacterized protein n=1 Tax=Suillus discolor TaxID=1912936 RepID=A0A9P7K0C3_9AGAM|nr:uncharacterized protein F5147DRAFT_117811 [Suillus discolor]KAG2119599.1 hypothetical protein F5147DRAFT_117811 [Suillus discolor]
MLLIGAFNMLKYRLDLLVTQSITHTFLASTMAQTFRKKQKIQANTMVIRSTQEQRQERFNKVRGIVGSLYQLSKAFPFFISLTCPAGPYWHTQCAKQSGRAMGLLESAISTHSQRLFHESFDLSRGSYSIPFLKAAQELLLAAPRRTSI